MVLMPNSHRANAQLTWCGCLTHIVLTPNYYGVVGKHNRKRLVTLIGHDV